MQQTAEKSAVSGYLAPGESIEATYNAGAESSSSYFLTDRRLIEISKDETGRQNAVTVRSDPLNEAESVRVSRVAGEDYDPNLAVLAFLSLVVGAFGFLPIIPAPIDEFAPIFGLGFLMIAAGFGYSAITQAADGHLSVKIKIPSKTRGFKLPQEAEDFVQDVVSIVGTYQK